MKLILSSAKYRSGRRKGAMVARQMTLVWRNTDEGESSFDFNRKEHAALFGGGRRRQAAEQNA
ncbi:hypothetical protein GGE07_003082 [Sinorhizobium terangae]|uniref:hypothetical protein n=1 Tax=Sinorhizobium terangae TaxID=110322 RepID=UPI00142EAA37|nr:hypothetical protein [Sinorhizobium terangae]MBB4186423.1 hypothetical protein [Sinorhizobium terangae]